MAATQKKVRIKLDLVKASQRFIEQLNVFVQARDSLFKSAVISNAIRRYETLWIPIVGEHKHALIPPLDIYLIWMGHMLNPESYFAFCQERIKTIPKHSLLSKSDYAAAVSKAKSAWASKWKESYEMDKNISDVDYTSCIDFPLEEAARDMLQFSYQVSLPHYQDEKFLKNALSRYKQFLLLLQYCEENLVPCYDIDLMWHTHLLHPISYHADTMAIVGRVVAHNQMITYIPQGGGTDIEKAFSATKSLWNKTYSDEYEKPGAMYRGRPRLNLLRKPLQPSELHKLWQKSTKLTLHNIDTQNINLNQPAMLTVKLLRSNDTVKKIITQLRVNSEGAVNKLPSTEPVVFSTSTDESIEFEIAVKPGMLSKKRVLMTGRYHLLQEAENMELSGFEKGMSVTLSGDANMAFAQIGFKVVLSQPTLGACMLKLLPGTFNSAKMPKELHRLWGPAPNMLLSSGMSDHCIIARHRLLSQGRQKRMGILVLHSIPLMMSSVQVFTGDSMLCSSYLIGSNQLPTKDQVQNVPLPCLDRISGSRAMLIKDNHGDYAIIIGTWAGYKQGNDSTPTEPGQLLLKLYNLRTNSPAKVSLTAERVKVDDVTVEMTSADVHCPPKCSNIPQKICTAFSAVLLRTLCEPCPSHGVNLVNVHKRNSALDEMNYGDDDDVLLKAVGSREEIPRNSFLKNFVPESGCAACWAKPPLNLTST